MKNRKVLIIGLDGATWDLLKPWAQKGILPTLKNLMEKGVYGNLESTVPPLTVPAWISFATGTNPGKHGCHYFAMPKGSLGELRPITSRAIHGETFYEVLEENKKKCILINLPGSYPPRIKGIVITSLLTQGDNFIFPPNLIDKIPELRDYRIIPDFSWQVEGKIDEFVNDVRKLERNRFECARKLFEKDWDFFFLLFSGTDFIQHQIYDKLIYGQMNEDSPAVGLYRDIDKYIGWFADNAPDDTDIFLVSDHGFKAYQKCLHINEWLRREGYFEKELRTKPRIAPQMAMEAQQRAMADRRDIRLPNFLLKYWRVLNWLRPVYKMLKTKLKLKVRSDVFQPKMGESAAYSPYLWAIYVNDKRRFTDGKVDIGQYEKFRSELVSGLKHLKDPQTGQTIVTGIWKKEDIYNGSHLDMAPDIVLTSEEYLLGSSIIWNELFIADRGMIHHSTHGIFLAHGSSIKEEAEVQGARIHDLAPTILHLFGLPIPKDMDGRVLTEIFKEASEPAQRDVIFQEVDVERVRVESRIKKLKQSGNL